MKGGVSAKMKIYTSYFDNLGNIDKEIVPISITGNNPMWFNGNIQKELIPELSYVKNGTLKRDKKTAYNKQLEIIKVTNFVKSLNKISEGRDVVLLSNELPNKFSHRKLVSEWLIKNNIKTKEL